MGFQSTFGWKSKGYGFEEIHAPVPDATGLSGGIRFLPYPRRHKICYPQSLEPCSIGGKDVSHECRRQLAYPKCLLSYWKKCLVLPGVVVHCTANKTHIIVLSFFNFSFVLLYILDTIRIEGILMANINVTIRMDEQLKAQADELFSDLGLSLSSAITMFVKQAVREQRIPFEIKRTEAKIQMATDSSVEKLSNQLIAKNRKAYEELAK